MTGVEIGWVAGIVEGEGWIQGYIDGRRKRIIVGVNMTDEDVIRRLHTLTGVGRMYGPYRGANKPKWTWRVTAHREVSSLLMTLYPLLGLRRQAKAREALLLWRAA